MKTTLLRVTLAFALMFAVTPLTHAQPNPDRPDAPPGEGRRMQPRQQQGQFQPGGPGGMRGGQGLPMMEQVLTEDQRDSMRQAMEAQREKMRGLQEKIRDARKALMTAALAEDFKETVVQAKALEVAKLEAEVTMLRLKALAEVQPALSKEQLEKLLNPPAPGMGPGGDGQRPNRRANRPPRDGDEMPQPPKRDPQ
jgi:Spy/CpxP family protein refolding chaperone